MINIIYGLRDPRNDVYQYIGKSTVGTERALSHLAKSHSPRINEWVVALAEKGLCPIVDIIEEVDKIELLIEKEKYWINYYHNINPELLNVLSIDHPLQNIRDDEDDKSFTFLVKIMPNISAILRKERLYRNLTQRDMALRANLSYGSLHSFELGKSIGLGMVIKYINALSETAIISNSCNKRVKTHSIHR